MADRLAIVNASLAELGEESLYFTSDEAARAFSERGDIEQEDPDQERVSALYPQVRSQALHAYPWSWLTRRAALTQAPASNEAEKRSWPFSYRFNEPEPQVRSIRAIYDRQDALRPVPAGWVHQDGYIFARFSTAWALYQRKDAPEESWPELFALAVTALLTARLSMALVFDTPATRHYTQMAFQALEDAKRVDSQSKPNPVISYFDWDDARVGGDGTYMSLYERFR